MIPAYWAAMRAPSVGMFHDDGVYLVTAKALATGHGYRILSLPGDIPQTKYPVLFPLALSWVWRLAPGFPANIPLLKLVPLTFGLIWFWLVYRLMAREASRETAIVCAVLTAAMTWSLYLSTALLSETMFAAECTACLVILREEETSRTGGRWWAAAVLAGLACLTRTAGICAIAAGIIFYLRRRRLGRAAAFAAVAMAVAGPWFAWLLAQHPPATDAYYSAANYASWNVLSNFFTLAQKMTIVLLNAVMLLRAPLLIGAGLNGWLSVLAGLTLLLAALRWLRELTVFDIFLGLYVAMTLAWAWPAERFLVVVYPLILFVAWRVWRAAAQRFPQRAVLVRQLAALALTVILVQSLRTLALSTGPTRRTGVALGQEDAWSDTSWQLDWIRDHTPADAVVLANLDPVFYLFTGRKAVRGFQADPYQLFYMPDPSARPLGTSEDLLRTIRDERVTYIVRAPNRTFAEAPYLDRLIMDLVHREPGRIRLAAQEPDPRFQIYRIDPPL